MKNPYKQQKKKAYFQQGGQTSDQGMTTDQSGAQDSPDSANQMQQIAQVCAQMLQKGIPPQQIVQKLVQSGVPQDQAVQIIQQVVGQMQKQSSSRMGRRSK